jgi:hypothetical protein
MGLSDVTIGTYRPQYRPLSAIRYLDVNPLLTRYTLFITHTCLVGICRERNVTASACAWVKHSSWLHCVTTSLGLDVRRGLHARMHGRHDDTTGLQICMRACAPSSVGSSRQLNFNL